MLWWQRSTVLASVGLMLSCASAQTPGLTSPANTSPGQTLPAPAEAVVVTDFSADLPRDDANATVGLRFRSIWTMPNGNGADVYVLLARRDGQWAATGHRAAADYNQRTDNSVQIADLKLEGNQLTGSIKVVIGPFKPPTRFDPTPATVGETYDITFTALIHRDRSLPYQPDREASMAPWRKDTPSFGGDLIEGAYTATVTETGKPSRPASGSLVGAENHPVRPGVFGAEGNIRFAPAPAGGVQALAHLSPTRVASPPGARIVKPFDQPQDWSAYDGLRVTVDAPRRRDDVTLNVSLRQADGPWSSCNGAALLLGRQASFIVPFTDFRQGTGGNYFVDVSRVAAIALGIDNPMGVGDVEFTVRRVELVKLPGSAGFGAAPASPVTLALHPAINRQLNGVGVIPKGLFGFHDVGSNDPKTPEGMPDPVSYMKQLNPGYLRPLDHVGFGAKPITDEQIKDRIAQRLAKKDAAPGAFVQRTLAADAMDNVVWTHTTNLWARPPWMDQDMPRFLAGVSAFYRNLAAGAWVPGDDLNPLRRLEVWNEPFMWARHMNMGFRNPPNVKAWEDPTQYGYLPTRVISDVWSDIFLAAVEGARSANPHVLLGGPSSPGFQDDHYGVFQHHIARVIDRCHDKLDFLTEHHYGGERDASPASYEVVTAYADIRHNRRIPIYNTECNDLSGSPLDKAHYNIEEILHYLRICPDKVVGRAMHALWNGYCRDPGETDAYTFLRTLRGAMVELRSSDPAILAAASHPEPGTLVVVAFNNSPFSRDLSLPVPDGFSVVQQLRLTGEDDSAGQEATRDTEGQVTIKPTRKPGWTKLIDDGIPAGGKLALNLQSRGAVRWTLRRNGYKPTVVRNVEQSFADVIMVDIAPSKPVASKIVWRGKGPAGAKSAVLRIVSLDVQRGEAVAVINGTPVPLPWASADGDAAGCHEIPIDPALLKTDTRIEFRVTDPANFNGFTVYAASIGIEH